MLRISSWMKPWKFIKSNKDKPFFAYLPFIEPHLAMHPPHSWVNAYPEEWDMPKKRKV